MLLLKNILGLITNPADKVLNNRQSVGSLWVGSQNALDLNFLARWNIRAVFSLCPVEDLLPPHIQHYRTHIRDHVNDQDKMKQLLPKLIQKIHLARLKGHNVLVHCQAGMQRAPTVVTVYLRTYYYQSFENAISKVRSIRPISFINGYTFSNILRK